MRLLYIILSVVIIIGLCVLYVYLYQKNKNNHTNKKINCENCTNMYCEKRKIGD